MQMKALTLPLNQPKSVRCLQVVGHSTLSDEAAEQKTKSPTVQSWVLEAGGCQLSPDPNLLMEVLGSPGHMGRPHMPTT